MSESVKRCAQLVIPAGSYKARPCGKDRESPSHPTGAYRYEGGEIGEHIAHAFLPPSSPSPAAEASDEDFHPRLDGAMIERIAIAVHHHYLGANTCDVESCETDKRELRETIRAAAKEATNE